MKKKVELSEAILRKYDLESKEKANIQNLLKLSSNEFNQVSNANVIERTFDVKNELFRPLDDDEDDKSNDSDDEISD
jgi:hypothetical protein